MLKNKMILSLSWLFFIIFFIQGCATSGRYVYTDVTPHLPEEMPEAKGQQEDWMISFFEKNKLVKQCPLCQRRYPEIEIKCPYDGAQLKE